MMDGYLLGLACSERYEAGNIHTFGFEVGGSD